MQMERKKNMAKATKRIQWEEPPPSRQGQGKKSSSWRTSIIEELQKNPGKWALVHEDVNSSGMAGPWRNAGCEAKTRKQDDGTFSIYARWPEE